MFNTPILDIAIGLVFIFLLYSLLATSINEAIATGLALRGRMLRKSIANIMLSNSSDDSKLESFFKGVWSYICEIYFIIFGKPKKMGDEKNIGDQFYEHPIIKNYAANRVFKDPSYLSASSFSTILIDVLKEDFNNKLPKIAAGKNAGNSNLQQVAEQLSNSSDLIKVKELFEYYAGYYANNPGKKVFDQLPHLPRGLDKEIHCILQLHLKNSLYDFNEFVRRVEGWYNDAQDRVTGWYKRQAQFISFMIGLTIACMFNVDTFEITTKLAKDKTAREQVVQLAIKATDDYKNDPRVQKAIRDNKDSIIDSLAKKYERSVDEAKKLIESDSNSATQLLAIGWNDYGEHDTVFIKSMTSKVWIRPFRFQVINLAKSFDTIKQQVEDDTSLAKNKLLNKDSVSYARFYKEQVKQYPVRVKTAYIWYLIGIKKIIGFLLTAFAISLGAPFWFDLLNKLVKLRAAGKKEDSNSAGSAVTPAQPSVTPGVRAASLNNSEEAVG